MLKLLLAVAGLLAIPTTPATAVSFSQVPTDTVWLPQDTVWTPGDTTWLPPDTVWVPSDTVYIQPPPDTVQAPDVVMQPPPDTVQLPPDTVRLDPPVDPDPPVNPPAGALWSTSFEGVAGSTQSIPAGQPGGPASSGPLPDNLTWAGAWVGAAPYWTHLSADRPHSGGLVYRAYAAAGRNRQSGNATIQFANIPGAAAQQREFWVRWYIRYDPAFAWGSEGGAARSAPNWDKMIYTFVGGGGPQHYTEWRGGYLFVGVDATDPGTVPGFSWGEVIGAANGGWVCIEQYMKMDTNGSDGAARIWIDGVLALDATGLNFSSGSADARNGWRYIQFHNNQGYPVGGPYAVDYDDMALYNTTPPNVDAQGNPMIGPVGQ